MKKKVLISGINGFLGSHLAIQLKSKFEVIGLESSLGNLHRIRNENFLVYESKVENLETIFKEHQVYAVVNVATIYRRSEEPILNLLQTNINLPVRLFELSVKYRIGLFLNTDSFFNDSKYSYSYLSDYTLSKKHSLEWLYLLAQNSSCKLVNMKIFHMYGENDSPGKFVPFIINRIKNNMESIDLTNGEQSRDFIYIKDVVDAYQFVLLNNNKIENKQNFEIGTGKSYTIRQLVNTIKEITGSSSKLLFGALPYREGEIMKSVCNNKELKELGWTPRFSLNEGLTKIIMNSN